MSTTEKRHWEYTDKADQIMATMTTALDNTYEARQLAAMEGIYCLLRALVKYETGR